MAEDGSRREILNYIEDQNQMGTYLTVGSLDYLKKGGDYPMPKHSLIDINIKPIIQMEDGS